MLKLKYKNRGEFFTDFEVFSQNVIISPIGQRVYKNSEPICVVRQVRPQDQLGHGAIHWVDLAGKVASSTTQEGFFKNVHKYLNTLE